MATALRHNSMTHGTLAPSVLETFHAAGHLRKLRVLPGSGCPSAFWNSLCFPDGQLRQEVVKGVQLLRFFWVFPHPGVGAGAVSYPDTYLGGHSPKLGILTLGGETLGVGVWEGQRRGSWGA